MKRFVEANLVIYALSITEDIDSNEELSTYSEAMSCVDYGKWKLAIQEEMESLHNNGTWDIVKLTMGKKTVRYKWVFKEERRHTRS